MERIPIEDRRAIIARKLRGASHQAVADEFGVSKGTVSHVLEAARSGYFPAFEDLEEELDALLSLAKRLRAEDLDVSAAHIGLDVMDWFEGEGLDPTQLRSFQERLTELKSEEAEERAYARAAIQLHELEQRTGMEATGRLGDVIELLDGRDDLQQLGTIAAAAQSFDTEIEGLQTAIRVALELQEHEFDLEAARIVAQEVGESEAADLSEAAAQLRERLEQYDRLEAAIEDHRAERDALSEEIEALEAEIADLQADRAHLRSSLEQLEGVHDTVEGALANQEEKWESLEEDISHRQAELERLQREYDETKAALDSIQAERDVVHAYRRLLRDGDVPDRLLIDVATLLDIREGDSTQLDPLAPEVRDGIETDLTRVAKEMLEGESFIRKAEHERQLRKKGETEATLEELESEREAVLTFMEFLETGEISVDLLEELRRSLEGRSSHLDSREQYRIEKVRGFLVERLEALTNDREVVDAEKHRRELQKLKAEHVEQLAEAYKTLDAVIEQSRALQTMLDEQWVAEVADRIELAIEESDSAQNTADLQVAIQDALDDELDRRIELACQQREQRAFKRGVQWASAPGVKQPIIELPEQETEWRTGDTP